MHVRTALVYYFYCVSYESKYIKFMNKIINEYNQKFRWQTSFGHYRYKYHVLAFSLDIINKLCSTDFFLIQNYKQELLRRKVFVLLHFFKLLKICFLHHVHEKHFVNQFNRVSFSPNMNLYFYCIYVRLYIKNENKLFIFL